MTVQDLPPGIEPDDRVVLFDGECVLCNAGARALIRADRHALFKLGTTQSVEGKRVLAWHGLSAEAPDSFVLSEGAALYLRSTAYIRILWRLSFPYKCVAAVFWIVPRPLRDAAYNWIGRNRIRLFGRQASCELLSPDNRAHLWKPAAPKAGES